MAKKLREQFTLSELRILALTGYDQTKDREKSVSAGFDGHFVNRSRWKNCSPPSSRKQIDRNCRFTPRVFHAAYSQSSFAAIAVPQHPERLFPLQLIIDIGSIEVAAIEQKEQCAIALGELIGSHIFSPQFSDDQGVEIGFTLFHIVELYRRVSESSGGFARRSFGSRKRIGKIRATVGAICHSRSRFMVEASKHFRHESLQTMVNVRARTVVALLNFAFNNTVQNATPQMKYIDVNRKHWDASYPVRIISELDDNDYEVRKMEVFSDGRMQHASNTGACGNTRLNQNSLPNIDEPGFVITKIDACTFEKVWREHILLHQHSLIACCK